MKADRGENKDEYMWLYWIQSLEARDRYLESEGKRSENDAVQCNASPWPCNGNRVQNYFKPLVCNDKQLMCNESQV